MPPLFNLPAVDGVEITTIADNSLDILLPSSVVPAHCTGWRATQRIAQMMPEA